jgi:hypothetical protein
MDYQTWITDQLQPGIKTESWSVAGFTTKFFQFSNELFEKFPDHAEREIEYQKALKNYEK